MDILVNINCKFCNKMFTREIQRYNRDSKIYSNIFCSRECRSKHSSKKIKVNCTHCGKEFIRKSTPDYRCSKNRFCSCSCSAIYNNTHKTTGCRRSKLEIYIEKRIKEIYGEDFALFNNKEVINSELDIYIPSLKLAIELNGIFHYEPIYGEEKLQSIKNNDERKFQACIERKISFCVIDTSKFKNFKEYRGEETFKIIQEIIEKTKNI